MSQVTASFQLFSQDGVQVAISLVGESDMPAKWLDAQLSQFYNSGYRNEPVEGSLKPMIVPIIGYVRTQAKPLNSNKYMPSLALFSPWGDFAAITIYPEQMADLPFKPQGKVWDGGAFDRKLVTEREYLTPCNMKILKEPVIDFEGKPKLTEAKNQKWRFARVIEIDGKPVGEAPAGAALADEKSEQPSQPPAPQGPDLEAKKKIIREFSGVAKVHWGDAGWQSAVLRIGQELAGKELKGLTELSTAELQKLSALVNLDAIGVEVYGNANDWYDAIPVLLTEFDKQTVYDLTVAQIAKMASQLKKDKPADQLEEDIKIPF